MALTDKILKYITDNSIMTYNLLKELAQIPSPSGKEFERIMYCKKWLESKGAEGLYIDAAGNLIYPIGNLDGPITVFVAHSDVVFPDEKQLPLKEDGDKIYCPGIGDDTANIAALLMVSGYIAENKITPSENGILIVIDTCEEGLGNLKGCREIIKTFGHRISRFYSFDLQYTSGIAYAVGSQRYKITVKTQGGHSYFDFGRKNAIHVLSKIIDRLYKVQLPEEGTTTYNVGTITGGTSVNSIAQSASMLYEFRSDNQNSLDQMENNLKNILSEVNDFDVEIEIENIGSRPCSGDVVEAEHEALLNRVKHIVNEHTGNSIKFNSGSTDCNIPLSVGIPSVCIGCYDGAGEHTRQEFIYKSSLISGYKIAFDLVLSEL